MDILKRRWKKIPTAVRKPLVFIVGVAVVVTGVAMLVLPGPGWAAIFLGLTVLATEFAFAERVRDWALKKFKDALLHGHHGIKGLWNRLRRRP